MTHWEIIAATGATAFFTGALWRRMFGGWLAVPRWVLITVAGVVSGILNGMVCDSIPLPLWEVSGVAFLIGLLVILHFDLGVQFDTPWLCAVRYELGPVAVALVTGQWGWLAIAPVIAFVYWLGRVRTAAGHPWAISWPWDTRTQQMTQGYTTFGELTVGALSWAMFVTAPLLMLWIWP